MASASSTAKNKTCFYCRTLSALLRPGWPLHYGGSAMLCDRCASAYEEGIFCDIFHLRADGWRDCDTCKKDVHCGCVMSTHTHTVLDCGGVRCTECIQNDISVGLESGELLSMNAPSRTWPYLQDPSEIGLYVDPSKLIIGDEKPQSDVPRKVKLYRQYSPKASDEQLQQIPKNSNSVLVPLFEKTLTISDADPKNGRMVVPKKCAKEFFPEISEPRGFPITIQDTRGQDWDFHYRFWPNNNSTMYVLEGFKDYLISNKCQAGNTVTFYRVDPEGKMVIGLQKTRPSKWQQKRNLRTLGQNANMRASGSSI